jgi:hypothetical protein
MAGSNSLWGGQRAPEHKSRDVPRLQNTECNMFERVVKLLKTDRVKPWRFHKTARSIFLIDFVSAFLLAMRYFFRPKVTLNYPFEKGALSPAFAASLHCVVILAERNAASPASCVRQSALRRLSPLRRGRGVTTARAAPPASTSI